jgi:MFS family permease
LHGCVPLLGPLRQRLSTELAHALHDRVLRFIAGIERAGAVWIAAIFTAALAVTVPLAGYIGDVFNRARIVTWSLFGWSLATLLSGFGSSFAYLVGIRSIATGAGEAFYARRPAPSSASIMSKRAVARWQSTRPRFSSGSSRVA